MIDEKFALKLLKREGASDDIIKHSCLVSKLALKIAKRILKKKKVSLDLKLVKIGGLLHDLGRTKTNSIHHGVEGAKVLRKLLKGGKTNFKNYKDKIFIKKLIRICERHIGAGIVKEEAVALGLGKRNFLPQSIEEQIIAHADNLAGVNEIFTIDEVVKKYKEKLGENHKATQRIIELNRRINSLLE